MPAPPAPPLAAALARLELQPTSDVAWSGLAAAFLAVQQLEGAETAAQQALSLSPRNTEAWLVRVQCARERGAHAAAQQLAEQALVHAGRSAALLSALGGALWAQGRLRAAAETHREAIAREPQDLGHYGNLATVLTALGDTVGALAALDRALALDPEEPRLLTNRAMALLGAGAFAEGFLAHEHRLRRPGVAALPGRPWRGQPLSGTLQVIAEQGFGDALQWARFLPRLAGRAGRVEVAVHPRLHQLFARIPGVDAVVDRSAALAGAGSAGVEATVALMSLPALLHEDGSRLAEALPLWTVDAAAVQVWRARMGPGLRVALAWSGNPAYPMDHLRSAPLEALAPLGAIEGLRLFAVQKQHGRAILGTSAAPPGLRDLGPELDTGSDAFVDTMAVMAAAELVVTTDTATAHLAGSLGCETWLLLSRPADWRWGQERADCPWYPTMRLFRQPRPGDWPGLVQQLARALRARIAGQSPPEEP